MIAALENADAVAASRSRFMECVQRGRGDECWPWIGPTFADGHYGWFNGHHGEAGAHRYAFEFANGPIPEGLVVCHTCDNPPCVNPAHLFLGTTLDNARDRTTKGRSRNQYDGIHCKRGHLLTPENTMVRRDRGTRCCKQCHRMRQRVRNIASRQARRGVYTTSLPIVISIPAGSELLDRTLQHSGMFVLPIEIRLDLSELLGNRGTPE